MNLKPTILALSTMFALGLGAAPPALASPANPSGRTAAVAPAPKPHASLRLDVARAKSWVGQSVPVTLRAYFRDVEAVTLGGAPQLTSPGVFTSDLSREPRQTTEVIGGEPVLVATWSGTVTPATEAPITFDANLPVHVRYRDRAPRMQLADPFGDEALDALAANPFDPSFVQRFFQQNLQPVAGRVHEETVTLRASGHAIDVEPLPTTGQPAGFTGAIGRFDVKGSASTRSATVSEPLTFRMTVDGDGDLDRVELTGVETSDDWKAYPPKSTIVEATKGVRRQKIFEQVLIPLRPGSLRIPAVPLVAFDPAAERYVTRETSPLDLTVAPGVASPERTSGPAPAAVPSPVVPASPVARSRPVWPFGLGMVALLAVIALGRAVYRVLRRRHVDRTARREMRRAAARGEVIPFYRAAHTLIETQLARRWNVDPSTISIPVIREHLGDAGDALTEAVANDVALRFGRAHVESLNLAPLCASIERSLAHVS